MATGFFAVLDDVATLLDDVATMTKVAAKKTAGLLGDDLAVNAEKATGFTASRELPVIWAITKGSLLNKLIILPFAFLMSVYVSWIILPILLLGGAYLSYEAVEKIFEFFFIKSKSNDALVAKTHTDSKKLLLLEKGKIKSAIRTDFILSIEIIMIALDTVINEAFVIQASVVTSIALFATVGVYGFVALLVRMDDFGVYLIRIAKNKKNAVSVGLQQLGILLITLLPNIVRILTVIGTIAMLLVGGGMYMHNIDFIHHFLTLIPYDLAELVVGLIVGILVATCMHFLGIILNTSKEA